MKMSRTQDKGDSKHESLLARKNSGGPTNQNESSMTRSWGGATQDLVSHGMVCGSGSHSNGKTLKDLSKGAAGSDYVLKIRSGPIIDERKLVRSY